jgi:hypothetical protein
MSARCWLPTASSCAPWARAADRMSLPEGLQFLKLGWWAIHVLAVLLVYSYAYRKGRNDERRAQRQRTPAPRAE